MYWISIILVLASFFCESALAQKQKPPSEIAYSADETVGDFEKDTVLLEGNVKIVFQGNYISAEKAKIYRRQKLIRALGKVIMQSPTTYSEASRIDYDYGRKTGTFYDAFLQSGDVVFEGKLLEKTGEKTYLATHGRYTACANCPPAWSFSGSRIEAELGGYADITYPVLRFSGVPVIALPWITVPLKSDRQSGLLVPNLEFSDGGSVNITNHYFWAISRSKDLTISMKNYLTRGTKGLLDYRYVLSKSSSGQARGAFIRDRGYKNNDDDIEVIDRSALNYWHYYDMPNDFIQRINMNFTTDLRYVQDFEEELPGQLGAPALENEVSITKNTSNQHFSTEIAYNVNLLQEDAFSDNQNAVHRFPEIRYSLLRQYLGNTPFVYDLNLHYVNFSRNGFAYDDICAPANDPKFCDAGGGASGRVRGTEFQRDGEFDPALDLIRTGQRLDLSPRVSLPFQIGRTLQLEPSLEYHETEYWFFANSSTTNTTPYDSTVARRYLETNLVLSTLFSRVYGDDQSQKQPRYKHEILPELNYSYIPFIERPEHIFWGTYDTATGEFFDAFENQRHSRSFEKISDEDFFGNSRIQFDYFDRVYDKNQIELALSNRLIRKRWQEKDFDYQRIFNFKLSQSYDFNERLRDNPRPWSPVGALMSIRLDNMEFIAENLYYPYAETSDTKTRLKFISDLGNFIELDYSRTFVIDENDEYDYSRRTEALAFSLGLKSKFIDFVSIFRNDLVTHKLAEWETFGMLKPPGDCWGIQFFYKEINLTRTPPKFGINFVFDFGGA